MRYRKSSRSFRTRAFFSIGSIILVSLASCEVKNKENSSLADSLKSTVAFTPPVPCLTTGKVLVLKVKPSVQVARITPEILTQVRSILQNRMKGLGIDEAVIQASSENNLEIFLPDNADSDNASRVIGNLAQLEFRAQKIGTEEQFLVARQVHSELLAQQETAKKSGNSALIAKNQKALQQNN